MFWQIILIFLCSFSFVWAEPFSPSYKPETKGKDLYSEAHKIYRSSPPPDNGVYEYGNLIFSVVQIDTKKENIKFLEATAMLRVVAQLRAKMPNLPMQFSAKNRLLEKGMDDDTDIYRYAVVFRIEDLIHVVKQEEVRKQEELRKQQEEARKQEEFRKQQEEARKQEELKQQEEARKQEELRKQQEEARKQEELRKQQEQAQKKTQQTEAHHNEIQSRQAAHENATSHDSQKPAIPPKDNTVYDEVQSTEPINKTKQDKDKNWINVQMMIE